MEQSKVNELKSKNEWDEVWKNTKLSNNWSTRTSFGLHFDKLMKKHLNKGGKLLEIGCASGRFLVYFNQEYDYDVYGVDYSVSGCKQAENNLKLTSIKGTIIHDDIFKCEKLERESFDVVFSAGFIEHFDDTKAVIEKHISFLKPGGTLIIELPNMLGLHGYVFKKFNLAEYQTHKLLTSKMIEQYLFDLRIQIQESRYIGSIFLAGCRKPRYIQLFFSLMNKFQYQLLKTMNIYFESEHVSPYILVIGKKPFDV